MSDDHGAALLALVNRAIDGARRESFYYEVIRHAEALIAERDRARTLITQALFVGKVHASEYAWEALVEGAAAALANEKKGD